MKRMMLFQFVLLLLTMNRNSMGMQKHTATLCSKKSHVIKNYHTSRILYNHDDKNTSKKEVLTSEEKKELDFLRVEFICNGIVTVGNIASAGLTGIPLLAYPVIPQTLNMILNLSKQKYINAMDKPKLIENLEFSLKNEKEFFEKPKDVDWAHCIEYSQKRLSKLKKFACCDGLYYLASIPTGLAGLTSCVGLFLATGSVLAGILINPYLLNDLELFREMIGPVMALVVNALSGLMVAVKCYGPHFLENLEMQKRIIAILKAKKETMETKKINNE